MALMRLNSQVVSTFIGQPEIGMGFQLGHVASTGEYIRIVGSVVAIKWDGRAAEQLQEIFNRPWMNAALSRGQQEEDFNVWLNNLDDAPPIEPVPVDIARRIVSFVLLGPLGPFPPPPPPPPVVYGHLPFRAMTGSDDVYYRYEPYPASRRIDQSTLRIANDTYTSPSSELAFMPTGFSAVARCALPSVFPARWRWEIQPVGGTSIRCGASVPLYGQSGGGVEVMFPHGTTNRGPIADPVLLPIM